MRKAAGSKVKRNRGASKKPRDLSVIIDEIIALIPDDFGEKAVLVRRLEARQRSLIFSAPELLSFQFSEVGDILNELCPDPASTDWSAKVANVFSGGANENV